MPKKKRAPRKIICRLLLLWWWCCYYCSVYCSCSATVAACVAQRADQDNEIRCDTASAAACVAQQASQKQEDRRATKTNQNRSQTSPITTRHLFLSLSLPLTRDGFVALAMSAAEPSTSRGAGLALEVASTVPNKTASWDGCKPTDMSCVAVRT